MSERFFESDLVQGFKILYIIVGTTLCLIAYTEVCHLIYLLIVDEPTFFKKKIIIKIIALNFIIFLQIKPLFVKHVNCANLLTLEQNTYILNLSFSLVGIPAIIKFSIPFTIYCHHSQICRIK